MNCKPLIKKIDHYDLTSRDLEESAEFYKKLGFKYNAEKQFLYGNHFLVKLHTEDSKSSPLPENVSVGSIDICFESYLLPDQIVEYLECNDIPIFLGPVERHGLHGIIHSVYVYDPSGNLLEFTSYCK